MRFRYFQQVLHHIYIYLAIEIFVSTDLLILSQTIIYYCIFNLIIKD